MAGEALVIGIILIGSVLVVTVIVAVLLLRRRGSVGGNRKVVPPPIDPGPGEPEQARDVNAGD